MKKTKLVIPALAIAMITGVAAGFAGMASAQTATTATQSATAATSASNATLATNAAPSRTSPHIDGNVTAINGTTITLTEEMNEGTTVYTVNAGGATVVKNDVASALSSVAVGDKLFVQGTANGATVNATSISDGMGPGDLGQGGGRGGPHIDGNITAINGTTITLTEETNEGATIYTVDASKATVTKNAVVSTLSGIAVGDKIFVQGTVTGSSVAASAINE